MKTEEINQTEENKGPVYEIGCLFIPIISDKDVLTEVANVKSVLEKLDCEFLSGAGPDLLDLAYPMKKMIGGEKNLFNEAYFVWLKFRTAPEKLLDLKKDLDKNNSLLRYLLMKTTEEDSLVSQKKILSKVSEEKEIKPVKIAKPVSIDEEVPLSETFVEKEVEGIDLDETIDKLVIK